MTDNGKSNSGKFDETGLHRLSDEPSPQESQEAASAPKDGATDEIAKLKVENEKLRADLEKARNEFLYLRAEFDNFKRHVVKERSDLRKYGSEPLMGDILKIVDIFEQALAMNVTPETVQQFRQGIELTATELKTTLNRFGVEEIPAKGQPFDPAVHEALSSEETDAVPPGHITQVFKKAYRLHDRVIRPAQVVVAKQKSS